MKRTFSGSIKQGVKSFIARYMEPEQAVKMSPMVDEGWYSRRNIIPQFEIPDDSGYAYVMSPYVGSWSTTYGVQRSADIDKYLKMYRGLPLIRAATDKKAMFAVGKGFKLQISKENPKGEEIVEFCNEFMRKINAKEFAISMVKDMLIFGFGVAEVCYKGEKLEKIKIENGGKVKELNVAIGGSEVSWVKPLDPRYMWLRRDAYGNDVGWVQTLTSPLLALTPEKIAFFKFSPTTLGYENAYGMSSYLSAIRTYEMYMQVVNDMMCVSHSMVRPPYVFSTSENRPYPSNFISKMSDRLVSSDMYIYDGIEAKPQPQPTGSISSAMAFLYHLYDQLLVILGVPPQILGMPEGSTRTTASVSLQEFIATIEAIQEAFADAFEQQILKRLLEAKFGKGVEIPELIWLDVLDEDENLKSARLREEARIGIRSINECRLELGLDKTLNPEDDIPKPIAQTPQLNFGFPPGEDKEKEKTEEKDREEMDEPAEMKKDKGMIDKEPKNSEVESGGEPFFQATKQEYSPPKQYIRDNPDAKRLTELMISYYNIIAKHINKTKSEFMVKLNQDLNASKKPRAYKAATITKTEEDEINDLFDNAINLGISRAEIEGDGNITIYNKSFIPKAQSNQLLLMSSLDDDLKSALQEQVAEGIMEGENYNQISSRITNTFEGVGYTRAKTIAVTELSRVHEKAFSEGGKSLGFEYKQFITSMDDKVCEICAGLIADRQVFPGKIFPIDEEPIPDLTHPNCRCYTTLADEDTIEKYRREIGADPFGP